MKQLQFLMLLLFIGGCTKRPTTVTREVYQIYIKADSLWNAKNDSAFYFFNKVATETKDSLYIALALHYMGVIQHDHGDYFGSQETSLKSLKYLSGRNANHHTYLSSDYNLLGMSSSRLKNNYDAIKYYGEATKFAQNLKSRVIYANNTAVAYEELKKYDEAIAIFESVLDSSKFDMRQYARILSNLAQTHWRKNPNYSALPALHEALQIRIDSNDNLGLNASYSHLADYHAKSQPDSALIYAGKMYSIAKDNNNPDDVLEALQKLIELSSAETAKKLLQEYQTLSDSVQTARNAAKNQFAVIRYETEKSKADNLRLQKDNAKKEFLLYATTLTFLFIGIISIFWHRKRQQKMAFASEDRIRQNQLKTSQKVHDIVANGLYRVMSSLEHEERIEKEVIMDRLEVLYEQSRDISYELPEVQQQGFQRTISDLLSSFKNSSTKVIVAGNYNELWSGVDTKIKSELRQILQELMVNMKKHSKASNVAVKFGRQDGQLRIHYRDDGIGLPTPIKFGNGLSGTENRIKSLDGQLTFDSDASKGVRIDISFPIG